MRGVKGVGVGERARGGGEQTRGWPCVTRRSGVIANLVIATTFLGEPYRKRDVFGGMLVVAGVLLIVSFAPQQSTT